LCSFAFIEKADERSFGVPPLGGSRWQIVTRSRGLAKAGTPNSIHRRLENRAPTWRKTSKDDESQVLPSKIFAVTQVTEQSDK